MTRASKVRVYPHGSPDKYAVGEVSILSDNQRSIAVMFEDKPPFVIGPGLMVTRDGKIPFFAYREEVGPWIELFNGGHYEIEDANV